jgi:DNA repair exonuclease SbcCD ATPase subunit
LEELRERFDEVVEENTKYKFQISAQGNKIKQDERLIKNMNDKIINSVDLETQIDEIKNKNKQLKDIIEEKESEIRMQRVEIRNIQEALEEMHESRKAGEVKKVEKYHEDHELAVRYKLVCGELEEVKQQVEDIEKYKNQISELCKSNSELLKKFKLTEKGKPYC